MKKTYVEPLVYCVNAETGKSITNNEAYAKRVKEKINKLTFAEWMAEREEEIICGVRNPCE